MPFLKGYARVVDLTSEERAQLAGLHFSRQVIDVAIRVGRAPETGASAGRRLPALRRDCGAKARELLAAL